MKMIVSFYCDRFAFASVCGLQTELSLYSSDRKSFREGGITHDGITVADEDHIKHMKNNKKQNYQLSQSIIYV